MAIGTPVLVGSQKSAGSGNSTGAAVTFTASVPAGDQVVVLIVSSSNTTTGWSVTDTKGNTYVADLGPLAQGSATTIAIFRANITSALTTSDTFSVTVPSSGWSFSALDCPGLATSPLDKTASATGSSTAPASGSTATTSVAAELVVALIGAAKGGNLSESLSSPSAGYTAIGAQSESGLVSSSYLWPYYQIVSSAGAQSFGATISTSNPWGAAVVTYKGAAVAVSRDVTSAAAISTPQTRDVTSAAAISRSVTRDVTSGAALSTPETRDVTTAAALLPAQVTRDVTSAAAVSAGVTRDVATAAALARSLTRDVSTAAALQSPPVVRDVSTAAALTAQPSRDVATVAALAAGAIRDVTTAAAVLGPQVTRDVSTTAAVAGRAAVYRVMLPT